MMKSTAKKTPLQIAAPNSGTGPKRSRSAFGKAALALVACAAFGMTACDHAAAQSEDGCSVNANYEIDCGPGEPGPTLGS